MMVGVTGFEPMASWSRTKRDTKLRHTPMSTTFVLYTKAVEKSSLFLTFLLIIPHHCPNARKCRDMRRALL